MALKTKPAVDETEKVEVADNISESWCPQCAAKGYSPDASKDKADHTDQCSVGRAHAKAKDPDAYLAPVPEWTTVPPDGR